MLQQSRPMDSPSSRDDGSSGPPSQCSSGNTSTSGLFTDELFSVATPTAGAAVCTASTATGHDTIMINTTSSREDTTDAALSLTYTSSHVSRTTTPTIWASGCQVTKEPQHQKLNYNEDDNNYNDSDNDNNGRGFSFPPYVWCIYFIGSSR
eukprot:GHVS01106134.1.p1 GENE.GHVS01106134.1~~GHVS01106134.1.p1  ORF type:complete len:151 (-),score=24.89 GHVS01106134.1:237-689(-)